MDHSYTTACHQAKKLAARGRKVSIILVQDPVRVKRRWCKLFTHVFHPSKCIAQILRSLPAPPTWSHFIMRLMVQKEKGIVVSSKQKCMAKYKSQWNWQTLSNYNGPRSFPRWYWLSLLCKMQVRPTWIRGLTISVPALMFWGLV